MKTNLLKSIFISLILVMGVSNAWAYNVNSPHVYFNATKVSSWPGVNIVVGHDNYSFGDLMSKVSNTNLYYAQVTFNGSDANGFVFIGANSEWGEWRDQSLYNRTQSQSNRTDYLWFYNTITETDGLPSGTYYFSTSGNKQAIDYSQYTTIPTFNTTSAVRVRTGTSGTYSDASGTYPANISIQGTYISANGETNRTSITSTKASDGNNKKVYGSVITGLVTLSYSNLNEAYTFDGWGTSNSNVSSTSTNYEFNQSAHTTVYAFFTKKTYTITYKQGANGSGSIDAGTKEHGVNYTLSSNKFTRTGYTQTGWSTSDGGAKVYDLGGTYTANTNVTLYPFWTPNQYNITYKDQNDATFSGIHADGNPTTHTYGTETTLKDPTRLGFIFGGWFTSPDCTGTAVTSLGATAYTADITLYAKWTPVPTLEISTNQQYLRTGKDKLQLSIEYANIPDGHCYRVKVGDGYWNGNKEGADVDRVAIISGDGSVTFKSNQPLGLGEKTIIVELWKASPFEQTGTSSNPVTVTVEQDYQVAVYAYLDGERNEAGGRVTSATPIFPAAHIEETITASQPNPGYSFVNWTASNNGNFTFTDPNSLSTTVTAIGGGDIYANYTKMYDVQVSVAAGQESWGSVSTTSTSVGSVSSEQITATANTNLGYVFDHWELSNGITITTGDANSASIKITATKTGSLTAHFRGENRPQNVYLIGPMNNWKQSDADWRFYKLPGESGNTVTLTKTINKSDYHNDGYKFGIQIFHSDWGDKNWKNHSSNDTKMDAHNCTRWGFNTKDGDKLTYIDLNVSGEYTFTLTNSDIWDKQALSITYPDKSFIEGAFEHAWDEEAYPLVENGDIQEVTIHIASKNDVEFRLVSHGKLFGSNTKILVASNSQELSPKNMEDNGAVMTIGAYVEGDYVFSYNKSEKVLTVTYPSVNQLQVYSANPAHDAAKKNWDWDSQNGNVYTKTLSLNANTTYTFKAVVNSDFYGKNETTLTRKNQSVELNTGGGNVTIKTDIAGNYTFTFNTSTKALSVTYPEAYTINYGVGTSSNGWGTVAIPDIASGTLVAAGTDLELSATPNLGYKFVGWYSEAACTNQVSTANPYNFPINSDTTLYAKFERRDLYIHTDIIWDWGTALMTQDKNNKAIYTYTTTLEQRNSGQVGDAWDVGYHFHFVNTPTNPNDNIAYNWDSVQTPTFEGASIDGVHLTFPANPTIQFGLTRKSDVTITLTLQSANDDPKPTVHISATPYYNITWDGEGVTTTVEERKQGTIIGLPVEPVRPGYTFLGWYNGENQLTNETTMPGGNITYTARWELRDLHIKANWLNYDPYWTYMQMEQDESNKALYTHTHRMEVGKFDFQIDDKVGNEYRLAYYFDNVQQPTTNSEDIANIQAKDKEWGDIQFDVTKKSFVTITLTLQEGNTKPTVELSSVPYYTLTYDLNYDAQNRIYYFNHLLSGDKIQIAEGTPTRPGYTFVKWTSASDGTGVEPDDTQQMGTEDRTYYAQWTPATYTVTLDNEGGSGVESVQATYGSAMPAITIPTKDDYLFMGYYDGDDGTRNMYYNADGTSAKNWDKTDNTTLYAKWIPYSQCIFFKNTLDWKNVYVYTFSDNVWYDNEDSNTQYGPGVCTKVNVLEFAKMTQIDNTDIYYYILTKQAGFNHIAFSDANMNNWNEFYGNNAIYRADRNDQLPLFIPKKSQTPTTTNSTKYYSSGIWMKYNSTESGYDWRGATDKNNQEQWSKKFDFTASKPGGYSFTATVEFDNTSTHYFKIHNTKGDWFGNGGTMTQNNCTNWIFGSDNSNNAKITPTITGTYIFTIYLGDGEVSVSLDYPLSTGDYRLVYVDDVTGAHPGHYIKKRNEERLDTVSFFVHSQNSPRIWLQYCTEIDQNGEATWALGKEYQILKTGGANPATAQLPGKRKSDAVLHVGEGCGIEESGVYNFVLQQSNSQAELFTDATHPYVGNFYIRTDAAEGGWDSFRQKSNQITYSSFADKHSNFNHYYCKYIDAGRNVKFTIANDYSYCISDTLDADNIIQKYGVSPGCLPANANVRFGWDSRNNKLTRAYIAGSSFVGDRFLVVTGNDLLKDANRESLDAGPQGNTDQDKAHPRYKLNANEDIFKDLGNWVYQVDVTAQNRTMINLTALYNGTIQYFKGAEGDPSYPLLASTNDGKEYKIRMIYNFKTNNLVVAWMPESPYNVHDTTEHLGTDMLLIRRNQEQATQLQLNSVAEKDTISGVKTAYAVMTFTQDFVEEDEYPIHERKHYWVSFPFDVKISDVFGFSEYKDHWIMQAYDGAGRAANGLWADTDTYWRYITNANYVMRKGQGYVLTLDVKKMLELAPVFSHTDEVSLYFPSRGELDTITSYLPTAATVPAHTCTIERENRKIYDSHWNMIGVPGFANIEGFNTPKPDDYLRELGYEGDSLNFYYQYIPRENSYQVVTAETTFQSMYSYMVQFAGTINWRSRVVAYNGQQQLAARRNSDYAEPEKVSFRLELAQGEEKADQTFVQLQQEGATPEFDMNLDLTKIINSGANIYTLVGNSRIQTAGNALPMGEAVVVPVGVKIDAEGEYTFRMPDGTEGMVVELVDYETYNRTNLLLTDYTVTLPKGTSENRFALHIQPQKDVVTSLENIGEGVNNGEAVNKYLIDGKLIIRTADGVVYDAQGKRL